MSLCNAQPPAPQQEFFSALAAGRAPHACLVLGPQGSGKGRFAQEAAGALLCRERGADGRACDTCPACLRARAGSHPDILQLRAAKASIGVEEVRALLAELANRSFEGGARAVIVQDAQRMTPQAQNALLKSLEEPQGETTYFLLATDMRAMLITIRSRCRLLRMPPSMDIARRLIGMGAEQEYAKEIEVLSGGAWERAKEMYASEDFFAARQKARRILALEGSAQIPPLWQEIKDEKEASGDILLWLEGACGDMLRSQGGSTPQMPATQAAQARFTLRRAQGMIEEIIAVRKRLAANVSWQSAVEPLLYIIAEGETR